MLTTSIHLLERLRHREDQAAWERFAALYLPLLLRWGRQSGLPLRDASDFVQDVLVILLQELPTFDYEPRQGRFRGWLKTIAVRRLADCRKRWNPTAPSDRPVPEGTAPGSEEALWEADDRKYLIRRALELMRSDFAETTWQACWELTVGGRTAAEVGRMLGMTEGSVYAAKSRVIRRLREEMQGLID
jgi:RNA polymerase sigma-70 factor (ECF subfamily)